MIVEGGGCGQGLARVWGCRGVCVCMIKLDQKIAYVRWDTLRPVYARFSRDRDGLLKARALGTINRVYT